MRWRVVWLCGCSTEVDSLLPALLCLDHESAVRVIVNVTADTTPKCSACNGTGKTVLADPWTGQPSWGRCTACVSADAQCRHGRARAGCGACEAQLASVTQGGRLD